MILPGDFDPTCLPDSDPDALNPFAECDLCPYRLMCPLYHGYLEMSADLTPKEMMISFIVVRGPGEKPWLN